MAAHAQIGDWLGVPALASEQDLLQIVEKRMSPAVIKRLTASGLERAEIDEAVIPSRTLQHRRSRREKLTLEESDRVLRMIRVLSGAAPVYGDMEHALAWTAAPRSRSRS